jgi:hypothetical protein
MNDLNFSDTIKPKSDQLNADDLLVGPITVTVTGVKRGNAEQPVSIQLNNGFQPFKPCKSMRRVLIAAWGDNGHDWIGKSMTLYCDPKVKYGGVAVGGIRISHLSDIRGEQAYSLTVTRGKREPFIVHPLKAAEAKQVQQYPEARFKEKLPGLRKAFHGDGKSIDDIARACEQVGRLTAVQREAITAKEEAKAPEPVAQPEAGKQNDIDF